MNGFDLKWNGKQLTAAVLGACRQAVDEGAEDVAAEARKNVPVDTGELEKTIEVVKFERPGVVGAFVKASGEKLGHVARFVELGTPGDVFKSGKRKGKDRRPIKAKPFLRASP